MTIVKITDATVEPITLAEAKLWLRVDQTDEDALIGALITSVRKAAEHEMQRTLIATTWELVVDAFPAALRLEMPKILSVASVKYIDTAGVEQTLSPADYLVDMDSEPGYVVPAYLKAWPSTRAQINAVRVRYTAGYGPAATDVPQSIVNWLRLHLEHYYRNRGAAVVGTIVASLPYADRLLDEGRVWLR
jgi:uncharacterized phiE125 gp8 family phage protein